MSIMSRLTTTERTTEPAERPAYATPLYWRVIEHYAKLTRNMATRPLTGRPSEVRWGTQIREELRYRFEDEWTVRQNLPNQWDAYRSITDSRWWIDNRNAAHPEELIPPREWLIWAAQHQE